MIWFGPRAGSFAPPTSSRAVPDRAPLAASARMYRALTDVATHSPQLTGRGLVVALAETGWVDILEAERMLPCFPKWDADRCFAEGLRRLSFRGIAVADEFRGRVARAVQDILGDVELRDDDGVLRFSVGSHEGVVLAHAEVDWTPGGESRTALARLAAEMPDSVAVVARSFRSSAAAEVSGLLGREVPGTLISVNQLLGMRAAALKLQPPRERFLELLAVGRTLRSADLAPLGER